MDHHYIEEHNVADRYLLGKLPAEERTRSYVERLEAMADERLPAGDELIADIERFLRDRGGSDDSGGLPN